MRGSINNQIKQIWYVLDGIGKSKLQYRNESDIKGENGHKVSPLVHSFRSKDEITKIAKALARYSRAIYKVRDMQQITDDIVVDFIQAKMEKNLSYRTLSTYLSQMAKIRVGLGKMEKKIKSHDKLFDKTILKELRRIAKGTLGYYPHRNRAYNNPISFKSEMSIKTHIAFDLQYHYGLRASEAILIRRSQLEPKTKILNIQGKGGYWRKIHLSSEIYSTIESELNTNGSYQINYMIYYDELKKAVIKRNEIWFGTHGLRYNYAQRKMQEYKAEGLNELESREKVSYELGHHRPEIINIYLGATNNKSSKIHDKGINKSKENTLNKNKKRVI